MRQYLSKVGGVAKWLLRNELSYYKRGQIISLWAGIESLIDMANAEAWRYSDRTISKVVPQSLRWKIELFQKIHRDLLPFQELRAEAAHLIAEVKRYQDDRHWLVHGYLVPSKSRGGSYFLTRGHYENDGDLTRESRLFTDEELQSLLKALLGLASKFALYHASLHGQIIKHSSDDDHG